MKKVIISLVTAGSILFVPASALAHVVVTPSQATIGSFETFETGVPNEKDMPVTGLKLVIPAGVKEVSPNVKPGWDINVVKKDDTVTEIDWTNGSIPPEQRDDFAFSAQVPAQTATLNWKAYQTYADGTVVSWDQTPNGKDEEGSTPYSQTKIVNDLASATKSTANTSSNNTLAIILGTVGTVLGASALIIRRK